ncbi:AfsR/SARP family transcriptional regulator [Streptomyces sp. LE64]|uniref:AfsR/SARP family transcriptional regulator n=1 Tax=Streptomyces sp. LE64 TaxID=3448653 RepID=UPI0040428A02
MEFEIRLSGSVEVRAGALHSDVGPTKTRLALAALAWDAGRTVSMDTLVHRVWDDRPPAKVREALHSHVSRIRKSLSIAGDARPRVVNRGNAYVLQVDPDRVDLRCYTNCVGQARVLRDSDDEESALRLLDRADTFWRGEPLAGIPGSWAEHLRALLAETTLSAAVTRAGILLAAGRYSEVVALLGPFSEVHPTDEAVAVKLAVALYGGNRTAEAARLLHRTRQHVARDSGLEAGRRVHRIQQGILSGTPAVTLVRAVVGRGEAPSAPVRKAPDNLPRDVPWAGRRDELHRLASAVCEGDGAGAVVTVEAIDGLGGVGKTALAVHLAHQLRDRFPDGRLLLHLGGRGPDRTPPSAARVLTELLRLLGENGNALPRELGELVERWRTVARDRHMLVILDDAAGSEQVRPLLPGASPTVVVVTSRRRLPGLPGVRPLSLDVLPPEDAVSLFRQRLGPRGGVRSEDVAQIVEVCGRIPLGVEIAASRLLSRPSWTSGDLLRQLCVGGRRLVHLRDGERSLAHVFALSYRALDTQQQFAFRCVGLHAGVEFDAPSVAALTGSTVAESEQTLEELLSYHLVSEPVPHRFTMHDLLRDYARSLVEAEDDPPEQVAGQRMLEYYLRTADAADRLAYPFRLRTALDGAGPSVTACPHVVDARSAENWLTVESANLLDALDALARQGDERRLALGVHALAGFLDVRGHSTAAEPLLRRAVAHWRGAGDGAATARALLDLCVIHTHTSRYTEAIATAQEAVDTARSLGDADVESEGLHQLSISLWETGQYQQAQVLQRRSLEFLLRTGDVLRVARCRNLLGIIHLHLAQNTEALECFTLALAEFTQMGDQRGRYSAMNNTAELYRRRLADPRAAEEVYREALLVAVRLGNRRDAATVQMNLAAVLDALGNPDEALALYGAALPVLREVGDRRNEAVALNGIGRALRAIGRGDEGLRYHVAALAVVRRISALGEEPDVLYDLAVTERDTGRTEQALAHLRESLAVSRRLGAPAEEARAARALAELNNSHRAL